MTTLALRRAHAPFWLVTAAAVAALLICWFALAPAVAWLTVTDYRDIMARGVMSTPGLVIDGKVMSVGRVPSAGDIAEWLTQG